MAYGSETVPQNGAPIEGEVVYDPNEVFKEGRERFDLGIAYDRKNRDAAREDLDFLAGNQWDQRVLKERTDQKRPTLTIPVLQQHLKQVSNELRKNPPAIKVVLADGDATPQAADAMEGMIRAIERVSLAHRVYSRAGEQAAGCGMGHFRLSIEREDPMKFDKCLRIRSIRNPFAVVMDPDAVLDDKSDAKWAFVYEEMTDAAFKKKFPKTQATAWAVSNPTSNASDGWKSSGKTVTVAEYWVVKDETVPIAEIRHDQPWFDPQTGMMAPPTGESETVELDSAEQLEMLQSQGFTILQVGEGVRKTVCMYILGGNGVIDGPFDQDGWTRIPIFTAVGTETELGGETLRASLIRDAKDAQRMLNYYVSKDVELHALAPMVPFILSQRQVAGLENVWATLNQMNRPYVAYNDVDEEGEIKAPRPSREQGIGTNPGLMAGAQAAMQYVKNATGQYDASLGQRSNETSGVAIEAREAQSDTSTYNFVDATALAVEACGRELVNMIPKVYSSQRMVRIVGKDDAQGVMDLEAMGIDLSIGKYDVEVKTGPAFSTQREEMKAGMREVMANIGEPGMAAALLIEIVRMEDFHGATELAQRLEVIAQGRQLIPPPPGEMPAGAPGMPPGMPPEMMGGPPMSPGGPMPPELANVIPFSPSGAPAPGQSVGPQAMPLAGVAGI